MTRSDKEDVAVVAL
jgi:hypothetical protein